MSFEDYFCTFKTKITLRLLAAVSWAVLVVIHLTARRHGLRTDYLGVLQFIAVYLLAAAITKIAFPMVRSRYQFFAFSAASAIFQLYLIWMPWRSAYFENWAASCVGALIGIGSMRLALKTF